MGRQKRRDRSRKLARYFTQLDASVQKMIAKVRADASLVSKVNDKGVFQDSPEWKVIHDKEFAKEFVRFNCRVNAAAESMHTSAQMQQQMKTEEERLELEVQTERERIKVSSVSKGHRDPRNRDDAPGGAREPRAEAKSSSRKAAGSGAAAVRAATNMN